VSAALGDYSTSSGGIWYSLNRFLFTFIVLTVAAVVGFRFLPEVSARREQEARLNGLKAEVEREQQLLKRNLREEELLKHDPEYIGIVARDRLDLMKDGETIYRIEPPKPDKSKMRLNR